MDAKFERRFKSFCNSLDALAEARQRDLSDSFVLSGTSAKFSITFDLSWKVMKDILVEAMLILKHWLWDRDQTPVPREKNLMRVCINYLTFA